MVEHSDAEPYLAGHICDAIAQHPELGELSIDVTITGNRIFLSGPVETEHRRELIADVAGDVAPDHEIVNETWVVEMQEPKGAEELT